MATAARGFRAVRVYLEMIKIEHSIFALPFALLGMIWAARGLPSGPIMFWIVVAMVSCRSAAMAFNRIADRQLDAQNPRTAARALPSGLLRLSHASLLMAASILVFLLAAWQLGPLTLALSPVALGITLGYSYTKRFTSLSHLVLGLALGIAPTAAWIAVRGDLRLPPALLTLGVLCWTAGFDVIYSLQDLEFDSSARLHSLPRRVGAQTALLLGRLLHGLSVGLLAAAGWSIGAGALYFAGVGLAAALLAYEQSLVRPGDLSRINLAFFTLNGVVSIMVFALAAADVFLGWAARR